MEALAPHLAELARRPLPPRSAPARLPGSVSAYAATTLIGREVTEGNTTYFVHRWSAAELERRWVDGGRSAEMVEAHRRAAAYWRWRQPHEKPLSAWPWAG